MLQPIALRFRKKIDFAPRHNLLVSTALRDKSGDYETSVFIQNGDIQTDWIPKFCVHSKTFRNAEECHEHAIVLFSSEDYIRRHIKEDIRE